MCVLHCSDQTTPKAVDALKDVRITLISGGWRHTVAADESGHLHAWGWNKVLSLCTCLSLSWLPAVSRLWDAAMLSFLCTCSPNRSMQKPACLPAFIIRWT